MAQAVPALDHRAIFESSPNPYMVLDRELRYVAANRAYCEVVGHPLEAFIGRGVFEAFPSEGEPRQLLEQSFRRVLREGRPDTIALISYAVADAAGQARGAYWSAVHTPLFDEDGEVAFVHQHTVDVTELQALKARAERNDGALLETDVFRRAREVQAENLSLTAETERMRELFMQAPGFMCVLREPDHRFDMVNHAYMQLIGHREVVGKPVREALPEITGQGFFELLDGVYTTGEAYIGRELPVRLQRQPDAPLEERFVDLIYAPIRGPDGAASGIFVEGYDVTDRVHGAEQQRLLIDELNHRVKNTLATVQAIASQTVRTAGSPEAFQRAFEARLLALSQAHNALTEGAWRSADLHEVLGPELSPYGHERAAMQGPRVQLPPKAALTLGLAFHELATNAAKYGALSTPEGRVAVRWRTEEADGQRWLRLNWEESGGPPVQNPARRGFGSRLIERSITGEARGEARLDFRPEGLVADIAVPLAADPAA